MTDEQRLFIAGIIVGIILYTIYDSIVRRIETAIACANQGEFTSVTHLKEKEL